jgi:ketosteroid isomerase-like protein
LTASELLKCHFQTLVADYGQWQSLIADDIVWELPYAPALGHPARLSGRDEVARHLSWFVGAVENFRFFDLRVHAFADPESAVAEVKAEGLITATKRIYRQDYVLFLQCSGGKITFLREYFDPTRAAQAFNLAILGIES